MKRETRLNLLFLGLFLAASLPGAVILFRKKLNPQARPIFMTDAIDRRVPYMAAGETPPGYKRVSPPLTEKWVAGMVRERSGQAQVFSLPDARGNRQSALSDDHQLQLVSLRPGQTQTAASFIWWNPELDAGTGTFSAATSGGPNAAPVEIRGVSVISLPAEVKLELMNTGLLKAPSSVIWVEVRMPPGLPPGAAITLNYANGPRGISARVAIP